MPHHFVIEPFRAVGPVSFGMDKDEVSRLFTYVYRSFFKGRTSKVRSDHCDVVGLIIHYNDEKRVQHIEIVKPNNGAVTLEIFGHNISGITVRALVEIFSSKGYSPERYYYGYKFRDAGISTYNSDPKSDDLPVECIGVNFGPLG